MLFYVCVVWVLKIYPLSKFQVHDKVFLTIIAMLYIRSPELIHLISYLYLFSPHSRAEHIVETLHVFAGYIDERTSWGSEGSCSSVLGDPEHKSEAASQMRGALVCFLQSPNTRGSHWCKPGACSYRQASHLLWLQVTCCPYVRSVFVFPQMSFDGELHPLKIQTGWWYKIMS